MNNYKLKQFLLKEYRQGDETSCEIIFGDEVFTCSGIKIREYNYLQVYPFDKWSQSNVPNIEIGQIIIPSSYKLEEGQTQPPNKLTETELLKLMEKYGIGTDSTTAEHIKTIQDRNYAYKEGIYFNPSTLGVALVQAYQKMDHPLGQPDLRAWMEQKITGIADGRLSKQDVILEVMDIMHEIYKDLSEKKSQFLEIMRENLSPVQGNQNLNESFSNQQELQRDQQLGYCERLFAKTVIQTQ
ncbi:DNA topoisomerase, type IA, core domain [Pseudocohnilembus persalinus]|uniref:DNA topoisomerase n=1 Tax=Pseudocohnilembus persalinus TaxID=266149 RepID=A0A0V0QUY6_PSEPJ|nr:DNA topoisomerase, type IA, core domain [Pseudocohnilembus persalinus]|eukprot:KRX06030.1 DNA topoisomerase, type IA, core domain [Pseudocohnilembus persalinus]